MICVSSFLLELMAVGGSCTTVSPFKTKVIGCHNHFSIYHLIEEDSDVVLETKVLVSRRLEDKKLSLGLGLGLDKKVLTTFKTLLF